MKALKVTLAPIQDEVIEYTKKYGRFKALEKYHEYVKDYLCFIKWLEEVTGDPNFGINPVCRRDGNQDIVDILLEKFLQKVANLQAQNEHLRTDNDYLRLLLDQRRESQESKVLIATEAL